MARKVHGVEGLRALEGEDLGASSWVEITQDQIDRFADATGDHQWIHVDPAMAATGPFGTTIAHGYLTLSLAPQLLAELVEVDGLSALVNYGLNRVRFPSPVPVGSKVRMRALVNRMEEVTGGVQATYLLAFEIDGQDKPACVAEVLFRALS